MVQIRREDSMVELGETREIIANVPFSDRCIDVTLRIIIDGFTTEIRGGQEIQMARCCFVGSGMEFLMPLVNLVNLRKVDSGREGLDWVRRRIEKIDGQIVCLIAKRLELAKVAGKIKRALGMEIEDSAQEARVKRSLNNLASSSRLDSERLRGVFQEIILWSKSVQK